MVEVDLKDVKALMDLMRKNSVSELELEKEGFKIRIKRGPNGGAASCSEEVSTATHLQPPPAQQGVPAIPSTAGALPVEAEIKSPMIGTFYRAPSPESAPYVEVGTEVNPDTVVCIIEAMKVMNEIKAENKGVITQVMVENAKPVEFNQPLFKLRPS
jgi:acetyl-CoA carboxylase biotin carboxyl carrier protein